MLTHVAWDPHHPHAGALQGVVKSQFLPKVDEDEDTVEQDKVTSRSDAETHSIENTAVCCLESEFGAST